MTSDTIRVLVVDDHAVVRKGLSALLSSPRYHIEVIGEARDGVEAVTQAHSLQPDVILMDLLMPNKTGLEALIEIRAEDPNAKVLILTSADDQAQVMATLKAGARGYLVKDSAPDELIQAIKAVQAGQLLLPFDLAQTALFTEPDQLPPPTDLTDRELDVLRYLAQGRSNQEIADALDLSLDTVRSHVRTILNKLHLTNRTQAALYALNQGLLNSR
jgi:two-component system, NarL family, response regulator LiaR